MTDHLYSRPKGGTQRLADELEKPLLDNRTYRVIELPNKLQALLIHDSDTDNAAAAMDVNVGSLMDPEDMQGIAHAVEHALFMGTKKYPGENDYNAYLTKYGGHSNAFTAPTSTNYYFELSASSTSNSTSSSANTSQASLLSNVSKHEAPLYGGLDRFAQFFIEPIFDENTLDRELKAVDSENKKNLQSDNWRLMQLNKSLSSPQHPYHLFATGNYDLLHDQPIARGVKIRDEFMKFYRTQYSANRMKLAVLGREDLDTLQSWVEEFFTYVPNQDLPQLRWDMPAFTEKELCIQTFVKPVMDTRLLDINFTYPDEEELHESQPGRYISHLIGHEGPGSILALLKEKGWANDLSAGAQPLCPGTAFFTIMLRLTTDGQKNYQEVIKTVFQYIAMIKESPPLEWIHRESAQLAEVQFRFMQKIPASRTVSRITGVMQKPLPRDRLLSGDALLTKFNPEGIQHGLDALRPDNFRYTLVSQDFPTDFPSREHWYGTEYKSTKIPEELVREIEQAYRSNRSQRPAELHLPHKNEFIPTRLDVEKKEVATPALSPKLVRNDTNVRIWHKKDDQFWVPKGNVYIYLRTPFLNSSAFVVECARVYKELVDDSLSTYAYDAELAGLEYGISLHDDAFEISISGYNDKMHVLLEKVLVSMRDLEIKQDRFDIAVDRLARGHRNTEYTEPFRQVSAYRNWVNKPRAYLPKQLLEELNRVTANDVKRMHPQFLRQMHLEIMAHGNFYKEDALKIGDLVEKTLNPLPLPRAQWPEDRSIVFPPGSDFTYEHTLANKDNVNHCIDYSVHIGDAHDRRLRAKLLLLSQIIEEPVFDTLRTKEQLGYVVGGSPIVAGGRLQYRILVQSERPCPYLEERIEHLLSRYDQTIKDMPQKDFEAHRVGVINKRLEKLKNLNAESGRLWYHVTSDVFDFELVNRDVEQLETLTQSEIVEFFNLYFNPSSPDRAKLSVYTIAQASSADIAANTSESQQRENLMQAVSSMLTQLQLPTDPEKLASYFEKIDLAKPDHVETITTAVNDYLQKVSGMAADQAAVIVSQAKAFLPSLLPSLGIKAPAQQSNGSTNGSTNGTINGHTDDDGQAENKKESVKIEDIKTFRSSMPLTPAAVPVKDITEFEDLEPKL
ncbi:hypothetical protein DOTSEDRAFT_72866 [Dothistroma septosporum NZE10]|uniref:Uncharacterized protein n=1 Tax=Dothistroma septosporum (strain NZE10 / CBS 128990) TaxID=675120 RepID=M2Y5W1_DOTSN|nr:hypothetical protein DOTSEDRAFT_72866 [Dothistroma septosporum NZE10]